MKTNRELADSFRTMRQQVLTAQNERVEKTAIKKVDRSSNRYASFKRKCSDLENNIDSFNTMDLVYFFRDSSEKAGKKYIIANAIKEMAVFKRMRKGYSAREIALMIEFLFSEEQDYIDLPTPNILSSSWCNTIFKDSLDWADGKYIPHNRRGKQKVDVANREYNSNKEVGGENIEIGEWE